MNSTRAASGPIALAIHGGAGTLSRETITPDVEAQYRAGLERALRAGHAVLAGGGPSLDAVAAAVVALEDDPLFNAGRGSVFTSAGIVELDASIMDGATGLAGAVAGLTTVKNPVLAARAVMERTKHVLLAGAGAERFAGEHGIERVDPEYFHTEHRLRQLGEAQRSGTVVLDHDGKHGTVGAVALDARGDLAAATSTGGMTNKLWGRVGDSPIIGAGTYADNATVAVSGTGTGEFFMRGLLAYDIAARMKYLKLPLADAVGATMRDVLDARGGEGGVIALDARGHIEFAFNTEGMYRGAIHPDGRIETAVYSA